MTIENGFPQINNSTSGPRCKPQTNVIVWMPASADLCNPFQSEEPSLPQDSPAMVDA